jgi:hypothetical protein
MQYFAYSFLRLLVAECVTMAANCRAQALKQLKLKAVIKVAAHTQI